MTRLIAEPMSAKLGQQIVVQAWRRAGREGHAGRVHRRLSGGASVNGSRKLIS
jgi:hypothetical protein